MDDGLREPTLTTGRSPERSGPSAGRVLDHFLFGAVPSVSLFLALNGKPITVCLFAGAHCTARLDLPYIALHVVVLVPMGAVMAARMLPALRTAASRGFVGAGAMVIACGGVLYFGAPASPLVFFLVVGVFASTTFVVVIEAYLGEAMAVEFWKLAFEALLKIFQWAILAVALMVSALAAFSAGHLDMTTTLAYPVAVIIIQLAMIAYWNLLAIWNHVAAGYRVFDESRVEDGADESEGR